MEVRRDSRPEFQGNSERKPWEEPKYRETSRKLRIKPLPIPFTDVLSDRENDENLQMKNCRDTTNL